MLGIEELLRPQRLVAHQLVHFQAKNPSHSLAELESPPPDMRS